MYLSVIFLYDIIYISKEKRKEKAVDIKNYALNSTPQMEDQINEIANSKAFKNDKIRIMPDGHADNDN